MKELSLSNIIQGVAKRLNLSIPKDEIDKATKERPAKAIAKAIGSVSARTINNVKNLGKDIKGGFLEGFKQGFEDELDKRRKP